MTEPTTEAKQKFSSYPLMQALREWRSRRFGMGMRIEKEPLAHTSAHEPLALSETEEAILTFAACGITGAALSDWTFAPGAGGNMMAGFISRTIPSADAISRLALVVINDEATYLMKRPCDLAPNQIVELVQPASQDVSLLREVRQIFVAVKSTQQICH